MKALWEVERDAKRLYVLQLRSGKGFVGGGDSFGWALSLAGAAVYETIDAAGHALAVYNEWPLQVVAISPHYQLEQ